MGSYHGDKDNFGDDRGKFDGYDDGGYDDGFDDGFDWVSSNDSLNGETFFLLTVC